MPAIGGSLLTQSPVLLVYAVGIVVSIVQWGRHPVVSMVTLAAMLILLASTVIFSAIYVMLPFYFNKQNMRAVEMGALYQSVNIVRSLIYAAGLGTWLASVFMGRGASESGFGTAFPVKSPPPPLPPNRFR
jgi:hypothetical protein